MRAIFREVKVNRYAFDVELLAVASVLKLNIQEMPVNLTIDRRFKVKDIARMFLDVLAVTYRYRLAHVYQKELAIGTTYAQDHPVQLAHHASAEA